MMKLYVRINEKFLEVICDVIVARGWAVRLNLATPDSEVYTVYAARVDILKT